MLDFYHHFGLSLRDYNLTFNPRNIVGDNENNDNERIYGNVDSKGPDPSHGTHVAGIVGADRNNDLGIKGVMPSWIPLACYSAIAAGTLSGGWKIVKTMGSKITKVTPLEGVAAETAGAFTLFFTGQMGIPVSTTHTITGSIIGVGATKRLSAVRWGVTTNLLWAWLLTIPVSAVLAAITYFIVKYFLG